MTGFCRVIIPVVYVRTYGMTVSSYSSYYSLRARFQILHVCVLPVPAWYTCVPAGQGTSLGKTAGVSCFLILLVLLRQLFCRFCFFTCAIPVYTLHDIRYMCGTDREFIWPFGNFWPWHCSLSSNFYLMLLHPATT